MLYLSVFWDSSASGLMQHIFLVRWSVDGDAYQFLKDNKKEIIWKCGFLIASSGASPGFSVKCSDKIIGCKNERGKMPGGTWCSLIIHIVREKTDSQLSLQGHVSFSQFVRRAVVSCRQTSQQVHLISSKLHFWLLICTLCPSFVISEWT